VSRVSPHRDSVIAILRELYAERAAGLDWESLPDESDLVGLLDLDSMDSVDLSMELERRLGASIEGKPSELRSISALLQAVDGALARRAD